MSMDETFERDLFAAMRDYVADAPIDIDPPSYARAIVTARPRSRLEAWLAGAHPRYVWPMLAGLVALALLAALVVGPGAGPTVTTSPTPTVPPTSGPSGQPTAGLLAFTRDKDVWLLANDESEPILAAEDAALSGGFVGNTRWLYWSPDGRTLAIVSRDETLLFDPTTLAIRSVPGGPDRSHQWGWTPDGRSLVVGSYAGNFGQPGLQTVDVGNDSERTLWQNGPMCQPSYSPDGQWIAAVRGTAGQSTVISPTTDLNWARLGSWEGYSCGSHTGWDAPTWSADSKRIAFISAIHGENSGPFSPPATTTITISNTDGSEPFELTSQAAAWARPLWSPDGEWIAYRRAEGLGLIRPDGSDARLLVEGRIDRGRISWRPDSSGIDFGRVIGDDYGPTELWTVDVATGAAEMIDVGGPVGDFARQP